MGTKYFCDICGKEIPNEYYSSDKDVVWSVSIFRGQKTLMDSLGVCQEDGKLIVKLIKQYQASKNSKESSGEKQP